MIVAERKLVLNPAEVQAARRTNLLMGRLQMLLDHDGYHRTVSFRSNYERDLWKQSLEDALLVDAEREQPVKCQVCGHRTSELDNVGTCQAPFWICEKCKREKRCQPPRLIDRRRY